MIKYSKLQLIGKNKLFILCQKISENEWRKKKDKNSGISLFCSFFHEVGSIESNELERLPTSGTWRPKFRNEELRSLYLVGGRSETCLTTLLRTTKYNSFKIKKDNEKLPQENNLFVYFFHSVEVCCDWIHINKIGLISTVKIQQITKRTPISKQQQQQQRLFEDVFFKQ
jgi:hypothetical protein